MGVGGAEAEEADEVGGWEAKALENEALDIQLFVVKTLENAHLMLSKTIGFS